MIVFKMRKKRITLGTAWLAIGLASQAYAGEFSVRDLQGIYNGRLSYGALYRLNDQDSDLVAIASDGNARTSNIAGRMFAARLSTTSKVRVVILRVRSSTAMPRNWWVPM